jgi:PAS domain-containing protein
MNPGMGGQGIIGSASDQSMLVAALAGLCLLIGIVLSILSLRQMVAARHAMRSARFMRELLDAGPSRAMLAHPDGRVELDEALAHDFGVAPQLSSLHALAEVVGGIEAEDAERLAALVRPAVLAGERIDLAVRLKGSSRLVDIRGGAAPQSFGAGTALLWVSDSSNAASERGEIAARLAGTEQALGALTQLIEAAPFPMWVRDGDSRLALVNNAFVTAVEAADANEVVERGIELVEGGGEAGARAGAELALKDGRPIERVRPATIGGERRMLRLVDVPLPGGTVAGYAFDIQELEDARSELERHALSQRELSIARYLSTTALSPSCLRSSTIGLTSGPNSTACWSECAKTTACPKCATSPNGRRSAAGGSPRPRKCMRRSGSSPTAITCGWLVSRFPMAACASSSRIGPSRSGWRARATRC